MSKKKKKKPVSPRTEAQAAQSQQQNKMNGAGGILVGVVVALIVFSFSGMSASNTKNWTEGVGTVISTYTITEEENEEEAGIYADIEFVDNTGATRTERSVTLKSELTEYVGKVMEIKYNPSGEGVTVVGMEATTKMTAFQMIMITVIIFVIFGVGELIKKALPTPEEYKQRHPRKK